MTAEESLLKQLLQERREGSFISMEESRHRTEEMFARTRAERWLYKGPAIDKAIAEADTGKVGSAERMNVWIASWDTADELPMPTKV